MELQCYTSVLECCITITEQGNLNNNYRKCIQFHSLWNIIAMSVYFHSRSPYNASAITILHGIIIVEIHQRNDINFALTGLTKNTRSEYVEGAEAKRVSTASYRVNGIIQSCLTRRDRNRVNFENSNTNCSELADESRIKAFIILLLYSCNDVP